MVDRHQLPLSLVSIVLMALLEAIGFVGGLRPAAASAEMRRYTIPNTGVRFAYPSQWHVYEFRPAYPPVNTVVLAWVSNTALHRACAACDIGPASLSRNGVRLSISSLGLPGMTIVHRPGKHIVVGGEPARLRSALTPSGL